MHIPIPSIINYNKYGGLCGNQPKEAWYEEEYLE